MRIDTVISMRLVCERITEMWSILSHLRAQRLNSCHMFRGVRVDKSESDSESLSSIHRRFQEESLLQTQMLVRRGGAVRSKAAGEGTG